jgi:tRNA(Ile)-lysidine synthase TilS/MesJ
MSISPEFITEFLNNPNWWFANDVSIDNYLLEKYGMQFLEAIDYEPRDTSETINQAIMLDQLVRHYRRLSIINDDEYVRINEIAYTSAKKAYKFYYSNKSIAHEEIKKVVFIMLAIRHKKDIEDVSSLIIFTKILLRESNGNGNGNDNDNGNDRKLLIRFFEATVRVFLLEVCEPQEEIYNPEIPIDESVLSEHSCKYSEKKSYKKMMITNPCDEIIRNNDFIISFSGGVDSSLLMKEYARKGDSDRKKERTKEEACKSDDASVCIYVNYGNRENSHKELAHVIFMATQRFNSRIFVVDTSIITRKKRDLYPGYRKFYESVTREARFAGYLFLLKKFNKSAVLLGHNKCDIEENIVTNIIDGTHFSSLDGMEYISRESDVTIVRPFLDLSKEQIYNHAKTIPFLKNSTPDWSRRGKIRNSIKANNELRDSIFKQPFIDGLVALAKTIKENNVLIHEATKRISYTINNANSPIILTVQELIPNNSVITEFLAKITKELKIKNISKKAIMHLCDKLRAHDDSNKVLTVIMSKELTLIGGQLGTCCPQNPWLFGCAEAYKKF